MRLTRGWYCRAGFAALTIVALAWSPASACDDVYRSDRKDELPALPDRTFTCQTLPWTDPDSPITNAALAPLLFYQTQCAAVPLRLVRRGSTLEIQGSGGCAQIWSVEGCLPLSSRGDTTQDLWRLVPVTAGTRVIIEVDVVEGNASCVVRARCADPPDAARGPLDPKIALYEPGVAPRSGPFTGFRSASECAVGVTGDSGCLGPTRDPAQDCMVCDNQACTLAAASPGTCADFIVTLPQAGAWTIAVAPQAPSRVAESEGCYQLTVSALFGRMLAPLTLVSDNGEVTFLRSTSER